MITKKFPMDYLPYDYEGIEKELAQKSSEGWQLVKAGANFWTFVKGECNEFQYNVTYIPDASEYRAEDTEHQNTLDDYCAGAGWERVCIYKKIQIYRNRDPLAVPIDTDEEQRLQMIHQAVKKWLMYPAWLWIAFFGILIVCMIGKNDPMNFQVIRLLGFFIAAIVWKAVDVINYYLWYHESRKSIAVTGKCCLTKRSERIQTINLFVFAVFDVWYVLFFDMKTAEDVFDLLLILMAVIFYPLHAAWIRKLCRYIGCPTAANRVITFAGAVVLSVICSAWINAMLVARGFLGF